MAADHWTPHPAVRSDADQLTTGERAAEWVAAKLGSWAFIIAQALLVVLWIVANSLHGWAHWDSYPFILLNLAFSTQAAFAAPVLQLAQNRTDKRRAELAIHQYHTTLQILQRLQELPRNPEK